MNGLWTRRDGCLGIVSQEESRGTVGWDSSNVTGWRVKSIKKVNTHPRLLIEFSLVGKL